jgi:hypothetical protein
MITLDLVQHALVTLVAMAAAAILLRRLVGIARPAPDAAPGCANCPSGGGSCQTAPTAEPSAARAEHPLVVVRPSRR